MIHPMKDDLRLDHGKVLKKITSINRDGAKSEAWYGKIYRKETEESNLL